MPGIWRALAARCPGNCRNDERDPGDLQGQHEGTGMQDDMIRDQKVASSLLIWTHVRSSERPFRSRAADEIWSAGPTRGKECVCQSQFCHFLWLLCTDVQADPSHGAPGRRDTED